MATKKKVTKKVEPFRFGVNPRKRVQYKPKGKSMTRQSFKDEVDKKLMMERFTRTGVLPNLKEREYGDEPETDFQGAQFAFARLATEFEQLPVELQQKYGSVSGLMKVMENPENHETLVSDGLLPDLNTGSLKTPDGEEESSPGEAPGEHSDAPPEPSVESKSA